MNPLDFDETFKALTGHPPFPWQRDLYNSWFSQGKIPASCNLPTGLGKTSVIAVWLIALANGAKVPRRLVYVVNRRTVVDQTTEEVTKYRDNLGKAGISELLAKLSAMPATKENPPLALSTLRGQFADNREWSADPSRPAVICGTVDMIGSRLLFSGYGVGAKSKPLHAGFLGQDALLVHDEAHLEPAFQKLIKSIEEEQERERKSMTKPPEWPKLRVMELTATSRTGGEVFELTKEEKEPDQPIPAEPSKPIHHVWRRMAARKALKFHPAKRDSVAATVGEMARTKWQTSGKRVLIFVRTIDDVKTVRDELTKKRKDGPDELRPGIPEGQIQVLTGTLRGLERDRMANPRQPEGCPVFARFLPRPDPKAPDAEQWKVPHLDGTVYLICTSAGEVGVDLSAEHMVCDLSTLDSMAQRFGRVNRRGDGDAEIDVVYETDPDPKRKDDGFEKARWFTKSVLERLAETDGRRSVSPRSLTGLNLSKEDRDAAFAPPPTILSATDILFDAWALTSITDKLPGRPKVEPYLHGITDWQPPETHVAWREEVAEITGDLLKEYKPKDLLEEYPLRPHELLREPSYRAFKHFEAMAKRLAGTDVPVWLLDDDGSVEILTLKELADKDKKDRINGMTVLLPPSAGGLAGGMLDGGEKDADDVADTDDRKRVRNNEDDPDDMRRILTIEFPTTDEDDEGQTWRWFEKANEGGKTAKGRVAWKVHVEDVERYAAGIVDKLPLGDLREVVKLAAKFHDHGKRRKLFQRVLGNTQWPNLVLAKSGKNGGRVAEKYRHEFGSLVDVERENLLKSVELQDPDLKELVLHLIAAHHGRGRPHFPADEAFDPDGHTAECERIARDTPRRFARLQRKFGRWGLAYLESLLRAADWAASGNPSAYLPEDTK